MDQVKPLVSVIVPAYQHVAFIERCLNGILEQKTTFDVEILVGEDGSTDGTQAVCVRYAESYPKRICLTLRDRKDVMFINGHATGRANFLDLITSANGKYIAVCEGDDYWIEPLKLQKQVDLLEKDGSSVGCFTDAYNEKGTERTSFFDGVNYRKPFSEVTEKDLVFGVGMPHCSMVYRKKVLCPLPKELLISPVADTIIFTHMSRFGHFTYLPEFTAVRTIHPGGIFSMRKRTYKLQVRRSLLPMIDSMTSGRYKQELDRKRRDLELELWSIAVGSHDVAQMREIWHMVMQDRKAAGWNWTTAIRNWTKAYVPIVDKAIGLFRN